MENQSGLQPRGRAVLVKTYEPEIKSGVIAIPEHVRQRMEMVEQRAIVVEIGATAWHDEPFPRAKVGDKVLVTKFAGYMAIGPLDGQQYRLINDRDIFAAITQEAEAENLHHLTSCGNIAQR